MQRIPEEQIERIRHHPEAFRDFLPRGANLEALAALLARGWWAAHDEGTLDADGLQQDGFVDETARLVELGTLLQLAGPKPYPLADWAENPGVDWAKFVAHLYTR